eukprot:762930-Hanusia_phi.AAC.8
MAVTSLGKVYVWGKILHFVSSTLTFALGSGSSGQLGQDSLGIGPTSIQPRRSLEPIIVKSLVDKFIVQVSAGWMHSIALSNDGEVWVWGGNKYGQLGLGDKLDRFAPVKLQDVYKGSHFLGSVISIAAGHGHSLFLNSSGRAFSSGRNDAGQLGVGDSIDRSSISYVMIPDRVWCDTPYGSEVSPSFADYVCVGSKIRSPCGRRCRNTLERRDCGPANSSVGYTASDCEPLMPITNIGIKLSAGDFTSYVISKDLNVYAWGLNTFGQIGIGSPNLWGRFITSPHLLVSLYGKNTTSIASGSGHTIARSKNEGFYILNFSPDTGPVSGGTPLYIIGQGFNTFLGNLECRFSVYSNGTHYSQYQGSLINDTIEVLRMPAMRYSSVRLKCITPDIQIYDSNGQLNSAAMQANLDKLSTPRNLTVWWKDKMMLPTPKTFLFKYVPLPAVLKVVPQFGPITGGSYILLIGYGFDSQTANDVRVRFGDFGNNWMRGCIITSTLITTVSPPSGPSNSGLLTYDGACVNLCPPGFDLECKCTGLYDTSPSCIKGIVRAAINPTNRANRQDRCTNCPLVVGNVNVRVSLNGANYGDITSTFQYYENPSLFSLSAPRFLVNVTSYFQRHVSFQYGGPFSGGTTAEVHGSGFQPAIEGLSICVWGCEYGDYANSIGPKCTTGNARHSLPLNGRFINENQFLFDPPFPVYVFDIIHFGTIFTCAVEYNSSGCPSYSSETGIMNFLPAYSKHYTPSFRGYNATTQVVTSCIEACESRAERVDDFTLRCPAPAHVSKSRFYNATFRLKLNGQDVFPSCLDVDCSLPAPGALYYQYYRQPVISYLTPNGGPLSSNKYIFVYGSGFEQFQWYPMCQFGKQTVVAVGNSTTFPGWISYAFQTNSSAWIVNDSLVVCPIPTIPYDAPRRIDLYENQQMINQIDTLKQQQATLIQAQGKQPSNSTLQQAIAQLQTEIDRAVLDWEQKRKAIHPSILGAAFPGKDGNLSTYSDNIIAANISGSGRLSMPFTLTLNAQDYIDFPYQPWPRSEPPLTRLSSTGKQFIFYPEPILLSSYPLGGPTLGGTEVILRGIGFNLYNEIDSPNQNWFRNESRHFAPAYLSPSLHSSNRLLNQSSIACRFGNETIERKLITSKSHFYGDLILSSNLSLFAVFASYLTSTMIRCKAPAQQSLLVKIDVSLNSRDFTAVSNLKYLFYTQPSIYKLIPSGGALKGGTVVTVLGQGFDTFKEVVSCRFGMNQEYSTMYARYFPTVNITSKASVASGSMITCKSPSRNFEDNVPFSITLNGQDYNLEHGFCFNKSEGHNMIWTVFRNSAEQIPALVSYTVNNVTNWNGCPYVYYSQPTILSILPAGSPLRGNSVISIFGRGFQVFSEDMRCRFGSQTTIWTRATYLAVKAQQRENEIVCNTPPFIVLTLAGSEVSCTSRCLKYPNDPSLCDAKLCSFNTIARIEAFKLAIAEVVGGRDIYGDIIVSPNEVVIQFVRATPNTAANVGSIDVAFCVHCVFGNVTQANVDDSLKIIEAVRNGILLEYLTKRFGMPTIQTVEIFGQTIDLTITLNGQDYTESTNNLFSFYLDPRIFSLMPAGGPLIRYETADAAHKQPTTVEIFGLGFLNYAGNPLCKFSDLITTATVLGDRLVKCLTPWPKITFETNCLYCIYDVWVEIALNGQDFTLRSNASFRYYLQPEFSTFSPLGGPAEGGTLVTFRGKGFNRYNKGDLRIQWGNYRSFPEESKGGALLWDDFDPTPPTVSPVIVPDNQISQKGSVLENEWFLKTSPYNYDQTMWDFSSSVTSNSKCQGMDLENSRLKVDLAFLPGQTSVSPEPVQSRSLYFTGSNFIPLAGRYIVSKDMDLSRGYGISFWVKRGNQTSPLSCETPDIADDLTFLQISESGRLYANVQCRACNSLPAINISVCSGYNVSNLTVPNAYKSQVTLQYPLLGKNISYFQYVVPHCDFSMVIDSPQQDYMMSFDYMSDYKFVRLGIPALDDQPSAMSQMIIPLEVFTAPRQTFTRGSRVVFMQECRCSSSIACLLPACPNQCECSSKQNINCTITPFDLAGQDKIRTLNCSFPDAKTSPSVAIEIQIRYVPNNAPPDWSQIQSWNRVAVFNTKEYESFTFVSHKLYQNSRGVRYSRKNTSSSRTTTSLLRCPWSKPCVNQKTRIMFKQALHGQGDYDNWAIDDVKVETQGGIISDSEIVAMSPSAYSAIPLTSAQKVTWKTNGKLTGKYTRGISIQIALNNQTYESAGSKNFCISPSDSKPDPAAPNDPTKNIMCDMTYFPWNEPNWIFQNKIVPHYTNWYEGQPVTDWGVSNQLFRSLLSEQFIYYQHPKVLNVEPTGGPLNGGTRVTVTGSGFGAFSDPIRTPKCKFGRSVVEAVVMLDTAIICTTPASLFAGYVDVAVSLNEVDFTSPSLGKDYSVLFLFYENPKIYSIFPLSGPSKGETVVFVNGSGFFELPSQPACRFVGVNDPSIIMDVQGVFLNDSLIKCASPSIANLCTPSKYCDGSSNLDPSWQGCNKWISCPFTNQCSTCGCPDGPFCQQYETDGSKVTRKQRSEEMFYSTEIQVSLNAICCIRDSFGKLTNPCQPCTSSFTRCGCIGDFTSIQYNQNAELDNTFTFYRESTFEPAQGVPQFENGQWTAANGAPAVITVSGQYFRNSSSFKCTYKALCNNLPCKTPPPVSQTFEVFGSHYFEATSRVLCKPPSVPGQFHQTAGSCQMSVAMNGIDSAKTLQSCDPNSCFVVEYVTPISAQKLLRQNVAISVSVIVFVLYVALQRRRYLKKNAKYVHDTGGEWQKPSLKTAMIEQNKSQVRKNNVQLYPIWKTSSTDLGQLGTGVGLYFSYLRYMTMVATVMAFICIPSLIGNSWGKEYSNRNDIPQQIRTSLGNIGTGWSQQYPTLPSPPLCIFGACFAIRLKTLSLILACIDLAITAVFIGATWFLKLSQDKNIKLLDDETISAADYTILVENIPTNATDPEEFRAFFSRYGEVADVAIGLNNGRLIDLFQRRGQNDYEIEIQTAKLKL